MYVEIPNLPEGDVCLAAVGEEYEAIISALNNRGIETICVSKDMRLEHYERSHPDLRLFHLGGAEVMIYSEDKALKETLEKKGFDILFADNEIEAKYPRCAALNALRIGKWIVCNKKAVDSLLLSEAEKRGLEIVYCNQGYSRCAVCVVSDSAAITSDPAIYLALKDKIDLLKISAGHIRLADTYDGMIGGCSFMIGERLLAFCGDIEKHPDFNEMQKFLQKHAVKYICLTKDELIDIGTAIPLKIK